MSINYSIRCSLSVLPNPFVIFCKSVEHMINYGDIDGSIERMSYLAGLYGINLCYSHLSTIGFISTIGSIHRATQHETRLFHLSGNNSRYVYHYYHYADHCSGTRRITTDDVRHTLTHLINDVPYSRCHFRGLR